MPTLPPINPDKSVAGIAVDPRTLERVIPASKRADGSVRKELKVRPGFTPQEDVSRFRGTRQVDADRRVLPKGHIIGWVPPTPGESSSTTAKSKAAKKNEKRKEKRKEKKAVEKDEPVPDNWDEDSESEGKKEVKEEDSVVDKLAEKLKETVVVSGTSTNTST